MLSLILSRTTIVDLIFGIMPIIMFIVVFTIIITTIRKAAKGDSNSKSCENNNQEKSERQLKNEEVEARLKNLYDKMQTNKQLEKQHNENVKSENSHNDKPLKSNRCKNCGAELELDKNGRKKCPYCQSKYF